MKTEKLTPMEKQIAKVRILRALWEQERNRWFYALSNGTKAEAAALRRSMNNLDRRLTNAEARLYQLQHVAA